MTLEGDGGGATALRAPPRVPQHDTLHTISQLVQTSAQSSIASVANGLKPSTTAHQKIRHVQSLLRKATLRLDPSIKRNICRNCNVLLLTGITASVRVVAHASAHMALVSRCKVCRHPSRLLCSPNTISSRLDKTLSRRRRKFAQRHIDRVAKVKANELALEAPSARNEEESSSTKLVEPSEISDDQRCGQRARRRRARTLFAMQKSDEERGESATGAQKDAGRPRKRQRCRISRRPSRQDNAAAISSTARKRRRSRKKSARSTVPEEDKALHLTGMPFCDRVARRDVPWRAASTSEACAQLTSRQIEALHLMRGNHIITRGLGRGGVPLDIELTYDGNTRDNTM